MSSTPPTLPLASQAASSEVYQALTRAAATGNPAKEVQTALNLIAAVVHAIYAWEVGYVQQLQQQRGGDPLPVLRRVWPRAMATIADRPMETATAVASTVEMALQEVLLPLLPPAVMDELADVNPSAAALTAQRELGVKCQLLLVAMRLVRALPGIDRQRQNLVPFITSMLLPMLGRLRLYQPPGRDDQEVDEFSRFIMRLIGDGDAILKEKHGYRNQGRFDDDADLRQEAPESEATVWWRRQRTETRPTLPDGTELLAADEMNL
jgi:hypothetical protein